MKLTVIGSFTPLLSNELKKQEIKLFKPFSKPLDIPEILEPKIYIDGIKEFNLNVKEGKVNFLDGATTKTYGVNANFLGPTIRVKKEDNIRINVKNSLKEETVLHWHGLKIPGVNDGGPNRSIYPNKTWVTQFKINQRASLCWYHPHTHNKTGKQVFMGIAGLFLIEDNESLNINLPKDYGKDDIPLVIQDRRFDRNGQFLYKQSMHDVMMGVTGSFSLINGVMDPFIEVSPKTIRFRILNGSNARIYKFIFSDNRYFYQVAGDSSFLPRSIKMNTLLLSPGERAEIVVDFSDLVGKDIYFGDKLDNKPLLKIAVKNEKTEEIVIPKKLTTISEYTNLKPVRIRNFVLNTRPGWLGINNKKMDMKRIDEEININETEIWRIKNPSRMPHPFHIHGCSFKIISRNGKKPYLNEHGLKDTVLVYGKEIVEIIVKFEHIASKKFPYMYHCHILEHEDAGMMGQFTVNKT